MVNGVQHWVRIAGTGQSRVPLVVLHGGPGGNHYVFERMTLPYLERFATVVCYEQRGCGRSARLESEDDLTIEQLVADLDELRRLLTLDRLDLLGYSFGAELALEYALAHAGHARALVLQAPSGIVDGDRAAQTQLAGFRDVGLDVTGIGIGRLSAGQLLARTWEQADRATVDRFLFEDQKVARTNRALWEESRLTNTGSMERALRRKEANRTPLISRVRTVGVPALILVGRQDRNVGVDACAELMAVLPDARLHIFERSAHFPDLEETVDYARVIQTFLSGI